ncbi:MAG: glycosyltransferase family 39 protein [Roseiflexus sp.]|nr:glycosyltransferase family 39 protein [Roseiflexus sp.]
MIRKRLDVFLTWAIALVCVVGGAMWQIDAASRQSVVIGGLNDRSYISGLYDREVSLSDGSPFRWAPPQGGKIHFWPLPSGTPVILRLRMHRSEAAPLVLKAGNQLFGFEVRPGFSVYHLLTAPGNKPITLSTLPVLVSPSDDRELGIALSSIVLTNISPIALSHLIAAMIMAPFLPLALLGLFWASLTSGKRRHAVITPLTLVATVIAGSIWPAWRLEIAWIAAHLCLVAVISVFVYRLAMRWPALRLRDDRAAIVLLLGAGMLTLIITYVPRIIGDGAGYYAYARSLVYRGDLVMDETFESLSVPSLRVTDKGLLANPWSVGPAMLWMGPLALYRLVVGGDGHEQGAYATVCLISAWAGIGTMIIAYRCARRWYSPAASAAGAFAAFYGSTLWYYSMQEGGFAHAISAFACALTVLAWLRVIERPDFSRWMALGAAAGLAALTYWATALLLIAPMLGVAHMLFKARHDVQQFVRICGFCLVAGLVAIIVFSPQMAVWYAIYGSPLVKPPGTPYLVLNDPHILDLFVMRFGLVRWTPLAMLGLIGLPLLVRRSPVLGGALIVAAVTYIGYNGLLSDWHGSGAFGVRRLTSLAAWYALGLAALAEALIRRRHTLTMLIGMVAGSWWMLMLLVRKGDLGDTSAGALEMLSIADLYLGRTALPALQLGDFLRSGFVWDTVTTAPLEFSVKVLGYFAILSGLALWASWKLAAGRAPERVAPGVGTTITESMHVRD